MSDILSVFQIININMFYCFISGQELSFVISKMNILVCILHAVVFQVTTAQDNTGAEQGTHALVLEVQAIRREMEALKKHYMLEINGMKNEMSKYKQEVLILKKRLDYADDERQVQRHKNNCLRKEMVTDRKERLILKKRLQALIAKR